LNDCGSFLIDCDGYDEDNALLAGGREPIGGKLKTDESLDSDGRGVDKEEGKGYNDWN
jgi:hypothetical protein